MCNIDKERNEIVNCLCCKHCLPPNKRVNGELCSLKVNSVKILCWNKMNEEEKANFMYELKTNCPVIR